MLAMVITAMGLFSLSSYMALQKSKEISIRKVFGATTVIIVGLISRTYFQLILISTVLIIPVSWFVMNRWLQKFAYHIDLSWQVFALAVLISSGITLFCTSFQSMKAARSNPAKTLRME